MRAAVITQFNRPWELKTLPDPEPRDGQVVLKMRASGMCGTDIHVHRGFLPVKPPIVAGHEPVGEVVAVGRGVDALKVGDVVGVCWAQRGCGRCRHCLEKRPGYCAEQQSWMNLGGGNAEYMVAWAEGCTLVPSGVSAEEAAPIFCAGYTVFSGLRNAAPRPGERVAVVGIGGLGHLAIQFARALGLEVVAVTGTESKKKEATELGASEVVVAGSDAGKALAAIGGADVVLSTSNSAEHAGQALAALRPEGRLVLMGVTAPLTLNPMEFMLKQCRVIGSTQNERRDLVEALELVAAKKVKPVIETYPFEKFNDVRERLATGKVRYRAVLQLS